MELTHADYYVIHYCVIDFNHYTDAIAYAYSRFGDGAGSYYHGSIRCAGSEFELLHCTLYPFYSSCDPDVGVRCFGKV